MTAAIKEEIAAFRRVAAGTFTGAILGCVRSTIDDVDRRWGDLSREPRVVVGAPVDEGVLACELHALQKLVADADGLPPPLSPIAEIRERIAALRCKIVVNAARRAVREEFLDAVSIREEIACFRRRAARALAGSDLDYWSVHIDVTEWRWLALGRLSKFSIDGPPDECLVARALFEIRTVLAKAEGIPPPPEPRSPKRERMIAEMNRRKAAADRRREVAARQAARAVMPKRVRKPVLPASDPNQLSLF